MLPPAPQLRSGGAGGGAGLESSLFLQVTASDCCSLCAKHHRLEVQQECTGSLGEGMAGPWALCPDTYGHTSSNQEESNGKQASQPGKTDLSRYGNLPRGPRGDTAQVPRAAWARGKQACWLPGATRAAATLSCRGAVLSLLSLAICLHPSCSVAPERGWHRSVLCVLPSLPRSGPRTVEHPATHSSWLASRSERQVPRASGRTSLSDTPWLSLQAGGVSVGPSTCPDSLG